MTNSNGSTTGVAALCGPLDDVFLMKLSRELGSEQLQLGVYLHLDTTTVQRLIDESKTALDTTFYILKMWRDGRGKREYSGAMFDELCQALSSLKRENLLDEVRREQILQVTERLHKAKETIRSQRQTFNEQMKLVKEEVKGLKEELESCRKKNEEQKTRPTLMAHRAVSKRPRVATRPIGSAHSMGRQPGSQEKAAEKEKSSDDSKRKILRAIAFLREYRKPKLWSSVSEDILTKSALDLSEGITNVQELQDLKYLFTSAEATNVTTLILDYCGLTGEEFADMLAEVSRLQQLKSLRLYNNDLHGQTMTILKDSLVNLTKLEMIDFSYCQLDDGDVTTLTTALPSMKSLWSVGLGGNSVGDVVALHITKAAVLLSSLQALWLPNNLLTEVGIEIVRRAAQHTPRLWLACLDWQRPSSQEAMCTDDLMYWQHRVDNLQSVLSTLQARSGKAKVTQMDINVIQSKLAQAKKSLCEVQTQ